MMQPNPLTLALLSLGSLSLISACAPANVGKPAPTAAARLITADGKERGSALLMQKGEQLELAILVTGLTPNRQHGIHLHSIGECQGPAFVSAGPHLNPFVRQHGLDNPSGSHLGDLPNIVINPDGTGRLILTLAGPAKLIRDHLFDTDGTAVVLHADPDDLRSDPAGNSGRRIACGTLSSQ